MTMGEEKRREERERGREGERATAAFVRARERERIPLVRFVRPRSAKLGLNAHKIKKNKILFSS